MKLENHEISVLVRYHADRIGHVAASGSLSIKWAQDTVKRIEELQAEFIPDHSDF